MDGDWADIFLLASEWLHRHEEFDEVVSVHVGEQDGKKLSLGLMVTLRDGGSLHRKREKVISSAPALRERAATG